MLGPDNKFTVNRSASAAHFTFTLTCASTKGPYGIPQRNSLSAAAGHFQTHAKVRIVMWPDPYNHALGEPVDVRHLAAALPPNHDTRLTMTQAAVLRPANPVQSKLVGARQRARALAHGGDARKQPACHDCADLGIQLAEHPRLLQPHTVSQKPDTPPPSASEKLWHGKLALNNLHMYKYAVVQRLSHCLLPRLRCAQCIAISPAKACHAV